MIHFAQRSRIGENSRKWLVSFCVLQKWTIHVFARLIRDELFSLIAIFVLIAKHWLSVKLNLHWSPLQPVVTTWLAKVVKVPIPQWCSPLQNPRNTQTKHNFNKTLQNIIIKPKKSGQIKKKDFFLQKKSLYKNRLRNLSLTPIWNLKKEIWDIF